LRSVRGAGPGEGSDGRFMPVGPFSVVILADVGDIDPRVRHLIDSPVAKPNPLVWIGIVWVCGGVVVPRRYAYDRAPGQHRRRIIRIDVVVHPVEIESVDIAQYSGGTVWQYRFDSHGLAAQVHVRLEVFEPGRLFQYDNSLSLFDGVRRYVEILRHWQRVKDSKPGPIPGHLAPGIEIDSKFDVVADLFADSMIVYVPSNSRAG